MDYKEKLAGLLDRIYELEGLVGLALQREEIPASLPGLISAKAAEVARKARMEENDDVPVVERDEIPGENLDAFDEIVVDEGEELPDEVVTEAPEEKVENNLVKSDSRPSFSINDRFRFRRTLFAGSDADFNSALSSIAALEDFDEAEAYCIGELGFDPENEETIAFLSVLRNYFKPFPAKG